MRRLPDYPIARRQVFPPSVVVNTRPSIVVTVAFDASDARTDWRSIASGSDARVQVAPSVEIRTRPPAPASQQTVGDGALPAVNGVATPVDCGCHVKPPSIERSTPPEATIRQRMFGSGERICRGTSRVFANACARSPGDRT